MLCLFYTRCNANLPKGCLLCTQNIFLEITKMMLANIGKALMFFLVSCGFLPSWFPMDAIVAHSFSCCWIMNSEPNWGKWNLQFCLVLGSLEISWMRHWCCLGAILVGWTLLGSSLFKIFFYLWDNGCHCGLL